MSTMELIHMHAELTKAVSDAVVKALKAGMAHEDVAAILSRIVELLEAGDD
jgi:hypothetical protein